MEAKSKSVVHVINNRGDRKIIPYIDPFKNLTIKEHNSTTNDKDYYIDIDWYLNNGYKTIEDARKQIEENNI